MSEKANVTFKVDREIKEDATAIFSSIGMNFTTGLEVYLRAVVRTGGIPFDLIEQPRPLSLTDRTTRAQDVSHELDHPASSHNHNINPR